MECNFPLKSLKLGWLELGLFFRLSLFFYCGHKCMAESKNQFHCALYRLSWPK